jgi:manganese-dependent inorganic pyrophosphatase
MNITLVTGYYNPDLDSTACAAGYAEFLAKQGRSVKVALFGVPHPEAQYVAKQFELSLPAQGEGLPYDEVILVDTSTMYGLEGYIDPLKVVEVIDHRSHTELESFPNAKPQIELVGAAATLIGEKFRSSRVPISRESAMWLAMAIASNTVNFQARVTTDRDREIYTWLQRLCAVDNKDIEAMFRAKSVFPDGIAKAVEAEFAVYKGFGIAQLEMMGVADLLDRELETIKAELLRLRKEKGVHSAFLSAIDAVEVCNYFVAADPESERLVSEALGVMFTDGVARRDGVLMRKEIGPMVRRLYG